MGLRDPCKDCDSLLDSPDEETCDAELSKDMNDSQRCYDIHATEKEQRALSGEWEFKPGVSRHSEEHLK